MAALVLTVWVSTALAGPPGLVVPNAKVSACSRVLDKKTWPEAFPFTQADLTPRSEGNDWLFYLVPRVGVHHAAPDARAELVEFYRAVLPEDGDVLDLCSSWTSHFPEGLRLRRCVALGLNPLELLANGHKTEIRVQDLNADPRLAFEDGAFDVVTCSLSVDYLTRPLELFAEVHRVLKPGGRACMAFTNRCFADKVVQCWLRPFSDVNHCSIVAAYFHYSAAWAAIDVVDVSPDGWAGMQNPMLVVVGTR